MIWTPIPVSSMNRHLGHDSIQLCTDTAQPRSGPGGPGLTSETSRHRADQCPLTTSETVTFSLAPPPCAMATPHPSDQLENDKDKLFYLHIESDTEKRRGNEETHPVCLES